MNGVDNQGNPTSPAYSGRVCSAGCKAIHLQMSSTRCDLPMQASGDLTQVEPDGQFKATLSDYLESNPNQ